MCYALAADVISELQAMNPSVTSCVARMAAIQ